MADLHSPGAVKGAGIDLRVSRGKDGASRSSNITPTERYRAEGVKYLLKQIFHLHSIYANGTTQP